MKGECTDDTSNTNHDTSEIETNQRLIADPEENEMNLHNNSEIVIKDERESSAGTGRPYLLVALLTIVGVLLVLSVLHDQLLHNSVRDHPEISKVLFVFC